MTLEPDGQATGCNPVEVGSIPTGVSGINTLVTPPPLEHRHVDKRTPCPIHRLLGTIRSEESMFELTNEQRGELSSPEPVAIDPQTRETYVLVRSDVYARLRRVLEEVDPSFYEFEDIEPG